MPIRLIQLLLLLLALIFGSVANVWAWMGHEESRSWPISTSAISLYPFEIQSLEQVGLIQIGEISKIADFMQNGLLNGPLKLNSRYNW